MGILVVLLMLFLVGWCRAACPVGFVRAGDACYKPLTQQLNAPDAIQSCKILHRRATLPTFRNAEDFNQFTSWYNGWRRNEAWDVWINGQDNDEEGVFISFECMVQLPFFAWRNGRPTIDAESNCILVQHIFKAEKSEMIDNSCSIEWAQVVCQVSDFNICESIDVIPTTQGPASSSLTPGIIVDVVKVASPALDRLLVDGRECSILKDTDIDGSCVRCDQRAVNSTPFAECCSRCRKIDGCVGWTWTERGNGTCWFKSSVSFTMDKKGATSGILKNNTKLAEAAETKLFCNIVSRRCEKCGQEIPNTIPICPKKKVLFDSDKKTECEEFCELYIKSIMLRFSD